MKLNGVELCTVIFLFIFVRQHLNVHDFGPIHQVYKLVVFWRISIKTIQKFVIQHLCIFKIWWFSFVVFWTGTYEVNIYCFTHLCWFFEKHCLVFFSVNLHFLPTSVCTHVWPAVCFSRGVRARVCVVCLPLCIVVLLMLSFTEFVGTLNTCQKWDLLIYKSLFEVFDLRNYCVKIAVPFLPNPMGLIRFRPAHNVIFEFTGLNDITSCVLWRRELFCENWPLLCFVEVFEIITVLVAIVFAYSTEQLL